MVFEGIFTMIEFYNIAGIKVPYSKASIDQNILNYVVNQKVLLYRQNGSTTNVTIFGIDFDLSICYRDDAGNEGKCYWYRFYRRQYGVV